MQPLILTAWMPIRKRAGRPQRKRLRKERLPAMILILMKPVKIKKVFLKS